MVEAARFTFSSKVACRVAAAVPSAVVGALLPLSAAAFTVDRDVPVVFSR